MTLTLQLANELVMSIYLGNYNQWSKNYFFNAIIINIIIIYNELWTQCMEQNRKNL